MPVACIGISRKLEEVNISGDGCNIGAMWESLEEVDEFSGYQSVIGRGFQTRST
jgi:hypothetical protein